jgi:hypothetical protein
VTRLVQRKETIELEKIFELGWNCMLSLEEIQEVLKNMQENERLLLSEGTVHLI